MQPEPNNNEQVEESDRNSPQENRYPPYQNMPPSYNGSQYNYMMSPFNSMYYPYPYQNPPYSNGAYVPESYRSWGEGMRYPHYGPGYQFPQRFNQNPRANLREFKENKQP